MIFAGFLQIGEHNVQVSQAWDVGGWDFEMHAMGDRKDPKHLQFGGDFEHVLQIRSQWVNFGRIFHDIARYSSLMDLDGVLK